MKYRKGIGVVVVLLLITGAGEASSGSVLVLPRPGQVGLSAQGGFGALLDQGYLGKDFSSGPGLAIRLRYRMRYERGLGLSFEGHMLDVRTLAPRDSVLEPRDMSVLLSGLDFYQLFHTRSRTQPMLSVGAGLAQFRVKLIDGETIFPRDGIYVSAGAGVERFFYKSWAFDLSSRYFAIFQNGGTNHDLQASAGIIFYASY